jgi:hypothetical protein
MQVSWWPARQSYTEALWLEPLTPENIPEKIPQLHPRAFTSISPIFIGEATSPDMNKMSSR